MNLTTSHREPSIFAALIAFNPKNLYQKKHKSFVFRSDLFCNSNEPVKQYFALEKMIEKDIHPEYSDYHQCTIFCNEPTVIAEKVVLMRTPVVIYIDNRELLAPAFNFYSDRFINEITGKHIFSERFVKRIADSFEDMYRKIDNETTFCWNNYSNKQMREIINQYKTHINSPVFQQYVNEK